MPKSKIEPRVRVKLEALGVDVVRAKLVSIMGVTAFDQEDASEPLGGGVSASRRQMQEWLKERDTRQSRWVNTGVIAALIAAVGTVIAIFVAVLAWAFPHGC